MWDGTIDARHLYTALRLTVHTYDRTSGAPTSTTGAGTGFVMARKLFNRTEPGLLVTNRHVLDPSFTDRFGLALDKVVVSGWRQRVHKDRLSGRAERFEFTINSPEPVLADGNADIAIIDLATAEIPGGCPEVTELRTTRLADSLVFEYRLHVGARILVPGYPSIGHVATVRPVLMGGTIASDPREDAVFGPGAYPGCVLSHSFSWGGMSGAPVFASLPKKSPSWDDMEQHRPEELFLIGVNRGHLKVGGTDEGAVTYFAKSMALARLLKSVGAQVLMKEWSDFEADDDAPLLEVEDVLLGSADDEPVA